MHQISHLNLEQRIGLNKIKFKNSMLRLSLCNYSDAYIAVKGTITVPNAGIAAAYDRNSPK